MKTDVTKDALERLGQDVIDGRLALRVVRFQQLNPEQKLAYTLEKICDHQKGILFLLEVCKLLTQDVVEWRKTPEGMAWTAAQESKRKRSTDAELVGSPTKQQETQ